MNKITTVFFGTHYFAKEILQELIENDRIFIDLVITKPDKKVGREGKIQKNPVKKLAEKEKLAIKQPKNLDNIQLQGDIDLGVAAQYGKIIPKHILNTPDYGILNVHASLLPKYRGASPIQTALLEGDTKTGVTIIKMNEKLDAGPIIWQKTLEITPSDKYPDVYKKLAQLGSQALLEAIPEYVSGKLQPKPQEEEKATTTSRLSREDGKIDWKNSNKNIYNKYRAFTPWPGIWTTWDKKRLKLKEIEPVNKNIDAGQVKIEEREMYIGCGTEAIKVNKLQLEGKKEMDVSDFINGYGHRINGAYLNSLND